MTRTLPACFAARLLPGDRWVIVAHDEGAIANDVRCIAVIPAGRPVSRKPFERRLDHLRRVHRR